MKSFLVALTLAALTFFFAPAPAYAWGTKGHETVAAIAKAELTPQVRAKVDALLRDDPDTLTRPDMVSRSTWADAWRGAGHRETAKWHYINLELGHPSLSAACFGQATSAGLASAGPADDCITNKIFEFQTELASPQTSFQERGLALKFLLHLVGDLHQPLHASDNNDRGGNCVRVLLGGSRTLSLHSYWDTTVVDELGSDPVSLATALRTRITADQRAAWQKGNASTWASETYAVSQRAAYLLGSPPGCEELAPVMLPTTYDPRARVVAALQLEKAGVRLGYVLNQALAHVAISPAADAGAYVYRQQNALRRARSPVSLECSIDADQRELHGRERRRFRESCMRG